MSAGAVALKRGRRDPSPSRVKHSSTLYLRCSGCDIMLYKDVCRALRTIHPEWRCFRCTGYVSLISNCTVCLKEAHGSEYDGDDEDDRPILDFLKDYLCTEHYNAHVESYKVK